ncbi:helix-turn-helix domain-containing protein [Streptomyces sp. NPDC020731]|uniref:helix-turn-helix domain-containing protein n=1 Tax=Streptomyces sp. NPDC020731 TaxID=3365085 RepID=UPI0037A24523
MTHLVSAYHAALQGQWDRLIGLPESSWLDVKSGIYPLDADISIAELCKDVAAMANSDGGLLLVGLRTELVSGREVISELKPVPQGRVDPGRYRKIINERVLPPVRDFRAEWVACGEDNGVLVLYIPRQLSAHQPFVVPAADPKRRLGVAVPVRSGDDTSWITPADLQRLLSLGWSADGGLSEFRLADLADRATAKRLLRVVPLDAVWLKHLRAGGPFHRIPKVVSDGVHEAQEALDGEVLRFRNPDLIASTEDLKTSVRELSNVFGGLHAPLEGPLTYFEVPPEWKGKYPERFYGALKQISDAAAAALEAHQGWVNKLNERGFLA